MKNTTPNENPRGFPKVFGDTEEVFRKMSWINGNEPSISYPW
jgi:hypothetical protein